MAPARRIALGPLLAAAGAVLLAVSLFLDWYGDFTAFTLFEVLDLLLVVLALASLVALADTFGIRVPAAGLRSGAALPLGLAAVAIVLSQLLNEPPAVVGSGSDVELGLWLALAGSLLLVAGSALRAARISLAVDVERRVAAPPAPAGEATDPDAPTATRPPESDPERPA